jgi:glycosyltransferase involved in cell wall biosynthesis
MRIGIEATELFGELRAGLFNYCLRLVQGLIRVNDGHQISLFTTRQHSPERWREMSELCRPLSVKLFHGAGRPYRLRFALHPISRQDVLFFLMGHVGLLSSKRINAFLIPDLTPIRDPGWHLKGCREHWLREYEAMHAHGDVIVTFSEHTKRDVVEHLGIPAEKIHAIPLAAGAQYRPLEDRQEVARVLQESGLRPGGYILSVGTLEPRKNHVQLIRAYHRLRERGVAEDQLLVLAGAKGWRYEAIFEEIDRLGLRSHVVHLGHYPRLEVLLNGATVMAYPSLYEGFGLPPLEAMACGTPVLASNASSLPEVVGDAGRQVDPQDEEAMAEALGEIIADADLRSRMRTAGLARAQQFSWDRTAQQTLDALLRPAEERHGKKRFRLRLGRPRATPILTNVT